MPKKTLMHYIEKCGQPVIIAAPGTLKRTKQGLTGSIIGLAFK